MTSPSSPLNELLTIVITTSAVQSNPSTHLTSIVMKSFQLAKDLCSCKKIIICDGMRIADDKQANWKAGRATQEAYDNYQLYIQNLQQLALNGENEWSNTTILPLSYRHGFSMGALEGIKLITTPYVMVVQHDRAFNQLVQLPTLMKDINYHHSLWALYVQELLSACNIVDLQWDPTLPQWSFLPTPNGMPPNPLQPARIPYFPTLSKEEQLQSALNVEPRWVIEPNEYTMNHLISGYSIPFPIPYPLPSTGLPLDPQYNDIVVKVTAKYQQLLSPFDNQNQLSIQQLIENATKTTPTTPPHQLEHELQHSNEDNQFNQQQHYPSSATTCSHFISRTTTQSTPRQYDIGDDDDDADITTKNSTTTSEQTTTNIQPIESTLTLPPSQSIESTPSQSIPPLSQFPGRIHFRKPQYPHPLPIHYVNFPANQTTNYLAHLNKTFDHVCFGTIPAYHTSRELIDLIKSDEYQEDLRTVRHGDFYQNHYSDSDSDDNNNNSISTKKPPSQLNKRKHFKLKKNQQPSSTSSSTTTSTSNSSSSDNDDSNQSNGSDIEQLTTNQTDQSTTTPTTPTLNDIIQLSNTHLLNSNLSTTTLSTSPKTSLPLSTTPLQPPHHQQYQFGSRFIPMLYWFDSTHIALTQWYKELYTAADRGSFEFLRPGDFAEDRYIQFQLALTNAGYTNELFYIKGSKQNGNENTKNIDGDNVNGEKNDNNTNNATSATPPLYLTPQQIRTTLDITDVGKRPSTQLVSQANKLFIPIPIDQQDEFQWTSSQSMLPFIYGSPPTHRVKDLQQVAFRIARCGQIRTFVDSHNLLLREMGMWLYEHSPISYNNFGRGVQDLYTHQYTCLKHSLDNWKIINDMIQTNQCHKRQMICGHLLTQINVSCYGIDTTPQLLRHKELNQQHNINNNEINIDLKNNTNNTNNDIIQVWAVESVDIGAPMTVKHLDGKAFLRYEQKLAKIAQYTTPTTSSSTTSSTTSTTTTSTTIKETNQNE